ncbi:PTS-dependent dihydroxyacetone kinase, phosphotransferase subunit dhaM Includes: Phosphocarrier protein HPr [Proteiniborus sp. DW1]|uniref:dihydroxyacetone kinase phosphoryl donor subunit DhaM n=1 Tax=Proteiniborus sp. DW1 TaxID=1889883 RepID=UPI00092E0FDE|nr:dihydroxyacetone kinase phosphoryl donor subunit DhaM [Proteiniborus sp. DW1]SCG84398.1 PTS-dependent dihydroxyacetone kinase, phosphotransferase subunit dhaM Includes: Phosphocarrier protein HPr [Proteiniborus sp. DW1]
MIGIVVVSHSNKISTGIVELCKEVARDDIKIISAGGTRDGRLGTDATLIMEAIEEANSGDGVAILADMGSSIMSSEMAIEMLPEEIKGKVVILDAPIVEGSLAVAIQACISNDLEDILRAGMEAKYMNKIGN